MSDREGRQVVRAELERLSAAERQAREKWAAVLDLPLAEFFVWWGERRRRDYAERDRHEANVVLELYRVKRILERKSLISDDEGAAR